VALTVLVLHLRSGLRDEALLHIMGANIMTLADTLSSRVQKTPVAAQIVLAEAIGVTIVSPVILRSSMVRRAFSPPADDWPVRATTSLGAFVGAQVFVPLCGPARACSGNSPEHSVPLERVLGREHLDRHR
jgi:hypothetical protein